jgi:hypothetical protein
MENNNNIERVVGYHLAHEIKHDDLEQVSGGAGMALSVRTRLTGSPYAVNGSNLGTHDTVTVFD